MKTKNLWKAVHLSLVSLACIAVSCSPDTAGNEIEHKLHEDPTRAVFTLQEGTFTTPDKFDNSPRATDFKPNSTPAQIVEWQTTAGSAWHVTSQSDGFKVKNQIDNPNIVYRLKMDYYNAKGELMNSQFYTNGQDKIHQHFFSMYKEVEYNGKKGSARVTNKAELPYDYRYADELNGNYIAETNPMGFDGFLRFTKSGTKFQLSVDLLHAAQSKFDAKGKPSPFYLPSKTLLSTGLWDINVKLPIEIDGVPTVQPADPSAEIPFQPARVEIAIYDGHLHGHQAFHQNPHAKEMQYLGKNYKITYFLQDGKWVADTKNPATLNMIGSKSRGGVAAFVIHYFDKAGNDITDQLADNDASKHYQHFFMAENIKPGYLGKSEPTDKNGTDFFDYVYCDTKPWDKTHKFDGAPFVGDTDPVGIKGYFFFLKSHKKFNLDIKLMYASSSKFTAGKPSPFYAPTQQQLKEAAWLPTITIPMNIYIDGEELELDDDLDTLGKPESAYSEHDRNIIHSLMDAFGITKFEDAAAEFYWNLNGEAKEDETGFWF